MTAPTIDQLREFRLQEGFSLRQVGERMGVHSSTIGSWESGRYLATPERLQQYATALGWREQRRKPPRTVNRGAAAPATSWQEQAYCRGVDPQPFFSNDAVVQQYAKDLCRACSVTAECLEWALGWGAAQTGIAGGLTDEERSRLRRNLNRRVREAL
ncbi:WhiB family transcriptional regulator [Streptosporangium sp. NPDC051022]|uniref:WhiB family transcriptional regulator n=1 Tax=Streptosporangium sp. NPDC051022 TaxID=3155752 RepID=UPI0034174A17